MSAKTTFLIALFLILLCFIAYYNSLGNNFVLDDFSTIVDNGYETKNTVLANGFLILDFLEGLCYSISIFGIG